MTHQVRAIALASIFVRVSLAAGFLSAVADRFGLWGAAGSPSVAWGGFGAYLAYTGQLLWFLPSGAIVAAGWAATALEIVLAIGLLVGVRLREFAFASGMLLTLFAITMTLALGTEPALSYSVWAAAAGAFLLSAIQQPREMPPTRDL